MALTIEHGDLVSTANAGRGVHSTEGIPAVADVSTISQIAPVGLDPKDRGRIVYQTTAANAGVGHYVLDGLGGFIRIGSGVTAHNALTGLTVGDDHTQYQLRSEQGAAGGYPNLNASSKVPDSQVSQSSVTQHVGALNHASLGSLTVGDPHTQYQLESEKGSASGYASLNGITKVPDSQISQSSVTQHVGALNHASLGNLTTGDPHTQYQLESEKNSANGYAGLDGSTLLNPAQVPDGADSTAIHDDTAGEIAAITEKLAPVIADLLLIEDSAAGNTKKRIQIGNLPSGGATDPNAVHVNVANEIAAIANKPVPTGTDRLLIEDTADSNNKKSILIGDLPSVTDPNAIHDNVAGEIAAITLKAVPIGTDYLLIEDSAASNNKKRVTIGSLPSPFWYNAASAQIAQTINTPSTAVQINTGIKPDISTANCLWHLQIHSACIHSYTCSPDNGHITYCFRWQAVPVLPVAPNVFPTQNGPSGKPEPPVVAIGGMTTFLQSFNDFRLNAAGELVLSFRCTTDGGGPRSVRILLNVLSTVFQLPFSPIQLP